MAWKFRTTERDDTSRTRYEIEIDGLTWLITHAEGGAIGGAHRGRWLYQLHRAGRLVEAGATSYPHLLTHWEAAQAIADDRPDIYERLMASCGLDPFARGRRLA